ncbi:hypothetical protein EDF60_2132 [Leucobacter luti]|nr:hypothetical protein EDF60_2132 [Leucobacter luti]
MDDALGLWFSLTLADMTPHVSETAPPTATESWLRLRPGLPVCWETTELLRVGFDRAVARVVDPTPSQQRLIGRLVDGFPVSDLTDHARAVGATKQQTHALLAALGPALESVQDHRAGPAMDSAVDTEATPNAGPGAARSTPRTRPPRGFPIRTQMSDGARPLPGLSGTLSGSGLCDFAKGTQPPELVIYAERFVEPLERAQTWLMAGTPHLRIRFTDTSLIVGPLVIPPGAPCQSCATLAVLERDSAVPVIAAQLIGTRPASETHLVSIVAAATATELIVAWRRGDPYPHHTELTFPVAAGRVVGWPATHAVRPHRECACWLLPQGPPAPVAAR